MNHAAYLNIFKTRVNTDFKWLISMQNQRKKARPAESCRIFAPEPWLPFFPCLPNAQEVVNLPEQIRVYASGEEPNTKWKIHGSQQANP
jgi:hypothetical protein